MKDLGLMEKNQTNETPRPPSMEANDSAIRNDRYVEKEKNSIDEEDNNEDPSVICSKDGVWLIDDDEWDHSNIASTSRSEKKKVCWKCKEEDKGTLLICSRKDCEAKVHKECMNCEVNFDEFGNFHCPVCWFDRVVEDYNVHLKMESDAKAKLVKFFPLLTKARKRLMVRNAGK